MYCRNAVPKNDTWDLNGNWLAVNTVSAPRQLPLLAVAAPMLLLYLSGIYPAKVVFVMGPREHGGLAQMHKSLRAYPTQTSTFCLKVEHSRIQAFFMGGCTFSCPPPFPRALCPL